jgi:hypothetical protein
MINWLLFHLLLVKTPQLNSIHHPHSARDIPFSTVWDNVLEMSSKSWLLCYQTGKALKYYISSSSIQNLGVLR